MYASALYNAYGMGNMEFPEIPDGDKYATYDDGKQMYGFLKGEVSSLVPYITNCVKDGSDYIITSQLRDKDTDEVKGTYEVTITALLLMVMITALPILLQQSDRLERQILRIRVHLLKVKKRVQTVHPRMETAQMLIHLQTARMLQILPTVQKESHRMTH